MTPVTNPAAAVGTRPVHWTARFSGLRRKCSRSGTKRVADFDTNPRTGRLYAECRDCRARTARRNADPALVNQKCGRLDTPAIRAAVWAVYPTLPNGLPACPICRLRPADVAEHHPVFHWTERDDRAPGLLRGYTCRSCKATLARYETRPEHFSRRDPARELALEGDVVGALLATSEALRRAEPSDPLVRRITTRASVGPFDRTAAGYWRAARYVDYPPVCVLMDMRNEAIWQALDEALAAGGVTAELAAIHCEMAGYPERARRAGVDPDAAIQRWAGKASAPDCTARREPRDLVAVVRRLVADLGLADQV